MASEVWEVNKQFTTSYCDFSPFDRSANQEPEGVAFLVFRSVSRTNVAGKKPRQRIEWKEVFVGADISVED